MNKQLSEVIKHWQHISPIVGEPKTKKQYEALLKQWEQLVELVGDDEKHKLVGLLEVVSHFLEQYNHKHQSAAPKASGLEVLKLLMTEHHLRQQDLTELGSQGIVSEILSGKRRLNIRQIKELAARFKVTPASFL
ncbi:MAG: transcriptional regulator [Gammaproteobacteria bacterium]|jgi:HTH-type transcriptional regulator/antitoxin HigA